MVDCLYPTGGKGAVQEADLVGVVEEEGRVVRESLEDTADPIRVNHNCKRGHDKKKGGVDSTVVVQLDIYPSNLLLRRAKASMAHG